MTDKATVEAVARVIAQERPWRIRRGRYAHAAKNWSQMTDDEIRAACFLAQAAITAYEAAKESTIQKAAEELVTVPEYNYLDGDVDLDHIQDWYMN